MTEELRFHIDQYAAGLVRTGLSPEDATRRAKMELGNVQEECRQSRGLHLVEEFNRELRYAARMLRKSPGFRPCRRRLSRLSAPVPSRRPHLAHGGDLRPVAYCFGYPGAAITSFICSVCRSECPLITRTIS